MGGAGTGQRDKGRMERAAKQTVARSTLLMFAQLAVTAHLLCLYPHPWVLTAHAWSFTDDKTGLERQRICYQRLCSSHVLVSTPSTPSFDWTDSPGWGGPYGLQ